MKHVQKWCTVYVLGLLLAASSGARADITTHTSRDWPAWRGDAVRSASTPVALPESLHPIWSRELGAPLPAWPESQHKIRFDASYEPVVAGSLLFVGSMVSDRITAYDTATGEERWRFYTDGPVRFAPVAWRDALYVVSDDGWIYCLEATTGALRWSKQGAPSTRWVLGNDRLISAWPARGAPVLIDEPNGQGTLYVAAGIWPFMGTFIHALDAATGKVRWTNSGSGSVYVLQQHGSPAFAGVAPQGYLTVGGDILMVSGGRTVPAAYNRHTGDFMYFEVANRTYGKDAGGYGVSVMGDHYINHGCVYALTDGSPELNLNDGKILPKGIATRIGEEFVSISAAGVALYGSEPVTSETTIVDRKGETKQISSIKLPLQQIVTTNMSARQAHFLAGNRLFLSGPDGWIGSVDLTETSDEKRIWETQIEGEIWTLIPGDGKLFAVTREGTLLAFGGTAQTGIAPHTTAPTGPQTSLPVAGPEGYALVWGLDDTAEEHLLRLASRYHVIGIDPDVARVQNLRRVLDDAGWYGRRIHLLVGDPATMPLPPYLANLVEIRLPDEQAEDVVQKAWHVLRPFGGVATFQAPLDTFDAFVQAASDLLDDGAKVAVDRTSGTVLLARPGALPDSASWTHQYADPANSVVSNDERVKPPLGLLWFGGPPNDDILPRHGHGPSPQVVGGRLFIEGPHALRAVDVYTGRLLWQRALPGLGSYYDNTSHQPGANEIGSNYVSLEDGVYVVYNRQCLRLDPVTGDTLSTFTLPGGSTDDAPHWGYVGVYEDLLIAGGAPLSIQAIKGKDTPKVVENASYASSSTQLIVMDRYSGRVLWQREAKQVFRHNAIIAAAGRIYCIDGLSQASLDLLSRRGEEPEAPATLFALDAHTGKTIWRTDKDVFGTWLGYSLKNDILIESGSPARDRAKDEAKEQMAAYQGADGQLLWRERFKYAGKPMLHDETIYTEGAAFNLLTGKAKRRLNPLTGRPMDWGFVRNYGCNTPIGGRHMLLFRSAAAGFYDLSTDGGTGNWGGFKSGCTANLIPADGVLSAPDYTRTCTCSYQNQCSLALVPMPDVEVWTFQAFDKLDGPLRRVAINFGAPGDWPAPDGSLWFEYPMVGGKGPKLGIKLIGDATFYRHHSLDMSGEERPVVASGIEGAVKISVPLKNTEEYGHRVRLLFAEPLVANDPGERVFDVLLQGEVVVQALDVVVAAGGARRTLIQTFDNVVADKMIELELRPCEGTKLPPVLSGIAIDRNEPLLVSFDLLTDPSRYTAALPEGTLQGILSVSNRYHQTLEIALSGAIAGESMAEQRLVLKPLTGVSITRNIPTEAINQGANIDAIFDLGAEFGRFRQLTEQFSLEAEVPVNVICTAPAIDQAHVEVSSLLADRSQNPQLTVLLDDQIVHESKLDLAPDQSHRVACNLPEGLLGRQATLSVKLRWPAGQCAVPGGFQQTLDFSELLILPRRATDAVAGQPPALTLGRRDGIFPENRRKLVGEADDLEAELDWWWDGEALIIHALVSDDLHCNNQRKVNLWDGDAMQVALSARNGPLTSVALALTEIGTEFWRYAGPDANLTDRVEAKVTRDDATRKTRYWLRLPLDSLGIDARSGTILRINVVLLDDDKGDGYRYWRQMTPGLAGGVDPEAYRLFVLGE